jgi:hypothetical protein
MGNNKKGRVFLKLLRNNMFEQKGYMFTPEWVKTF